MKKTYLLFTLLAVLLSSCFKPEEVPPLMFDGKANMTIADFQKYHELSHINPITLIEDDIIITGVITSTDQFGSCYKEIFFQDSTGGLSLLINNTSYYSKYRMGQRVFVKAKGLYLGNYVSGTRTGFYQLGLYGNSNGGMKHITSNKENQHIFRHDLPDIKLISNPKIITSQNDIATGIGGDYHKLVKLENCFFTQANGTTKYFEPSGTNTTISRIVKFNNGTGSVEARISAFNTFADNVLPQGALNITGILTMFDITPQLIICNINDVEIIPPAKILKSYDMKTNPLDNGWENVKKIGETGWNYIAGSHMQIQAPSGTETECWFVSPKFNFAGEKDVTLSFSYRINTGTSDNLQAIYTTNGSDWKPLNFTLHAGGTTEATVKLTDEMATNPELQIAFKYKTTAVFPMCAIYNVTFKANVN